MKRSALFPRAVVLLGAILLVLLGIAACAGPSGTQWIFEAAKKGEIAALKAMLPENRGLANARGEAGRLPLREALLAGKSEAARFLIDAGSDVDSSDVEGIGPLGYAALVGDASTAEMLVGRGTGIEAQDTAAGGTPLHLAVMGGHANVFCLLIEKGSQLDVRPARLQSQRLYGCCHCLIMQSSSFQELNRWIPCCA